MQITDDLAASFRNGMALCALIHAYDPNILAWDMLDAGRELDNLALGMQLAQEFLGVPRMLEPEDVAEADDKAMMVYLYEFPKAFLARLQQPQGNPGEEAARRQEEADRRRREEEEERLRREAEERRRREEEDARRLQEEEERRRMAELAAQRQREEEMRQRAAAEEMLRRQQEEERARLLMQQQQLQQQQHGAYGSSYGNNPYGYTSPLPPQQQPGQYASGYYAPQPPVVAQPPQVITNTIVIKESSNIGKLVVEVVQARHLKVCVTSEC